MSLKRWGIAPHPPCLPGLEEWSWSKNIFLLKLQNQQSGYCCRFLETPMCHSRPEGAGKRILQDSKIRSLKTMAHLTWSAHLNVDFFKVETAKSSAQWRKEPIKRSYQLIQLLSGWVFACATPCILAQWSWIGGQVGGSPNLARNSILMVPVHLNVHQ